MTNTSNTTQNSNTNSSQQGTSSSSARTSQYGTNNSTTNVNQNTTQQSQTGPVAAAMAILNRYSQDGLSQDQISKYMSPYQQQVINATMAQQQQNDSVQQNALKGNAISQGALGGDRSRIAQAELMRGQGLNNASTLANLNNTAYTQALQAAQSDRTAALQAAGMMGTQTTGSASTTGTNTTAGTSSMTGTQDTSGQFQSTGQSSSQGAQNTTTGPGSGWGTVAAVAGMLADGGAVHLNDGGAVHRDMGGGVGNIAYLQPMAIPTLNMGTGMTFAPAQTHPLPKLGEHARKKINSMLEKASGEQKVSGPGSKMGGGNLTSGSAGGGGSPGMGSGGFGGDLAATEGAAPAAEGGAAEGGAAAGEGAAGAAEGASEGAAAAGEGAAAAGEGAGEAGAGMGEALSGVGEAIASLFSDRRLKENIRPVGKLFDGQTVHAFNYKGSPATQIGLIAQEVQHSHPEAVGSVGGAKTVNYDRATDDAARRVHRDMGGGVDYEYGVPGGLGALANLTAQPDAADDVARRIADWERSHPQVAARQAAPVASASPGWMERIFPHASTGREPTLDSVTTLNQPARQLPPPAPGIGALSSVASPMMQPTASIGPTENSALPTLPAVAPRGGIGQVGQPFMTTLEPSPIPEGMVATPVKTQRISVAPEGAANVVEPGSGIGAIPQAAPEGAANLAEPGADQIAPNNHAVTVANELRNAGASDNAIRGILANAQDESGINPGLRHPDQPKFTGEAHYAHGIFQEGGENWNKYEAWLKKEHKGSDWRDPALQTQFLAKNLQENYPSVWKVMNNGTPEQAAQAFLNGYLKPAEKHRLARNEKYGKGVLSAEEYQSDGDSGDAAQVTPQPRAVGKPAADEGFRIKGSIGALIDKLQGREPAAAGPQTTASGAPVDRGGLLKRLLGVDFNPLQLSDAERMGLIAGGLGGVGQGVSAYNASMGNNLEREKLKQQMDMQQAHLALQQQQVNQAKQSFNVVGQNPDGTPQYGFVNSAAGTVKPVTTVLGMPQQADFLAPELSAQEAIAKAPPYIATMAQKYANYELPPPTGKAAQDPRTQRAMQLAEKIKPGFNISDYTTQKKVKESFGSGPDSNEVKSYNTVMDHVSAAKNAIDQMGNLSSSMLNSPYNAVREQTSSSFRKAKAQLLSKMEIAIGEVNKATTGNKLTVDEAKHWREELNANKSPDALHETLQSFMDMIHGRMEASASKYNTGMKLNQGDAGYKTAESLLSSSALKKYNDVRGTTPAESNTNQAPITPRPAGVSNIQLHQEAIQLAKSGKDLGYINKQLSGWGVPTLTQAEIGQNGQ